MSSDMERSVRAIRPSQIEEYQKRRSTGQFRDLPPVQELFERGVVAAWRAHQAGMPLTVENMRTWDESLTEVQIGELVESPMFIDALTARGIPFADTLGRLSAEQLFVLQAMVDPSIDAPVMARLRKLGVSYSRWSGWLKQPAFAATYVRMIESAKTDIVGPTMTNLQIKAQHDVAAMKLVLEIGGAYVPGGSKIAVERNYDAVIRVLMEAIQTHVHDPETLAKIGAAVQKAANHEQVELKAAPGGDMVATPAYSREPVTDRTTPQITTPRSAY